MCVCVCVCVCVQKHTRTHATNLHFKLETLNSTSEVKGLLNKFDMIKLTNGSRVVIEKLLEAVVACTRSNISKRSM